MPHLVFEGPIEIEDIFLGFAPIDLREGDLIAKAQECYLNKEKSVLLIRSLVVERGFSMGFMMKIARHAETNDPNKIEFSLGLEPVGSPERTDGVKRYLGYCAWVLMQSDPEVKLLRGNIMEQVKGPKGA
ncbi:MAG: hypothetical protein ACFCU1_10465 [Sumerlaeia bacterium]